MRSRGPDRDAIDDGSGSGQVSNLVDGFNVQVSINSIRLDATGLTDIDLDLQTVSYDFFLASTNFNEQNTIFSEDGADDNAATIFSYFVIQSSDFGKAFAGVATVPVTDSAILKLMALLALTLRKPH